MAVAGWILDKSAAARSGDEPIAAQLEELAGSLYLCPVAQLEQLYSSRSAQNYDELAAELAASFQIVHAPGDIFDGRCACNGTWRITTACGIGHPSRTS